MKAFGEAQNKANKKFVLHSFPLMKRTKNLGFINFLEIQILEAKQSELASLKQHIVLTLLPMEFTTKTL